MRRFVLVVLTLAAASPCLAATPPLSADNFGDRFNATMRSLGDFHYRAGKTECKEAMAKACTYSVSTVSVVAKSRDGGSGFDYVSVICGSDCDSQDFAIVLGATLRVVAPGLPRDRYGEWIPLVKQLSATGNAQSISIGRAEVRIEANSATGVMGIVALKN